MVAHPKAMTVELYEGAVSHILLAVDGSGASLRAASQARRLLASFPGARLTVLYVAPLPRELQVSGSGEKLVIEFPISNIVRATAAPILQNVTGALGALAGEAEFEVQVGEPAREICAMAASEGADLILMGVRGFGAAEVGLGSVSSRVLSLAPCPVMVVQ